MSRPMERCHSYFYPRPPRGGRRGKKMVGVASNKFLSTPSARRATEKDELLNFHLVISIHALREEGDFPGDPPGRERRRHFYPRPPRGGRHGSYGMADFQGIFLSTPSARRATLN